MHQPGSARTLEGRRPGAEDRPPASSSHLGSPVLEADRALDSPPEAVGAEPAATRRHVRTQASGKAAIALAGAVTLLWLAVNSQALVTLAGGLVFAVVVDGWLARRAVANGAVDVIPVGPAVAGTAPRWTLHLDRVVRPVAIRPAGERRATPVLIDRTDAGVITTAATGRGLVRAIDLDVLASGPIGLCRAARRVRVVPGRPRVVGPLPAPDDAFQWPPAASSTPELTEPARRGDDLFRGVRPYQRGDERRKVHWKATARTGQMMVREEEGSGDVALQVVLDLDGADVDGAREAPDPDLVEEAVSIAAAIVEAGRLRGWTVQLVTVDATPDPPRPGPLGSPFRSRRPRTEPTSPPAEAPTVAQRVRGDAAVRRQLATAGAGRPAAPPWAGLRCTVAPGAVTWS